jgi:hypothetical protein
MIPVRIFIVFALWQARNILASDYATHISNFAANASAIALAGMCKDLKCSSSPFPANGHGLAR